MKIAVIGAGVFTQAGVATTVAENVIAEIWSKLALNVCPLPTSALLRLEANQLVQQREVMDLMAALLREVTQVAAARHIPLDYEVEFAVVVGRPMKDTPESEVMRCVAGYTILHDVSARSKTPSSRTELPSRTAGSCGLRRRAIWSRKASPSRLDVPPHAGLASEGP
jgi:hypothetical protein